MAQIGTVRLETQNSGVVDVPVFEPGDSASGIYEFVRLETASGPGFIPVTDPADATYPYLRVQSQNNGIVAVTDTPGSDIPDSGSNQWYIDEGSGSTLQPDVGSVTATINGATWQADSNAVGDYHLSHAGSGDIWQTDSGVLTPPFSVGGWVRFDDMTEFENSFAWNNSDNSDGERMRMMTDGDGALLTVQGGGSLIRGQSFPTTGNWGFWALNMESDQHRLITWSNSQELDDNSSSNNNNGLGSDRTLIVGTDDGGHHLSGDTDFYVVSEGSLLSKSEWTDLWQATQR